MAKNTVFSRDMLLPASTTVFAPCIRTEEETAGEEISVHSSCSVIAAPKSLLVDK